ncbi:hypothetical protein BOX15_Mlig025933g4 [Macrostomum lignano]|uniref:Neutral ceramidase n=2 Tax=Macrostomum lignano TaxID=282301 RepID=A0A267G6W9_9PLAT|nr:hypothetical protein BOX15_Mlig025933g4 [Macrostomum lignano]
MQTIWHWKLPMALILMIAFCILSTISAVQGFEVGAAMMDITGPVAQVNTMGYAHAKLSGLHTRLFCRAFAFRDSAGNSAAYAVLDLAMVSHLLSFTVGKRLSEATGGRFSETNVMLSATHTHAGPGGFNQDLFVALNTPGFDRAYFNYIVDGVVQSILAADRARTPARVLSNSGHLYNASVNRHPHQYLLNPAAERARYPTNVDTEMHLLRFDDAQTGAPLGSIAWFPVHGTSLKVSNRYVSGDNKGIASQLMERHFNGGRDWPPAGGARGTFVAAFPQSHSGDVSPNVRGVFRVPDADGAAGEGDEVEEVRCNSSVFKTFDCESKGPGKDQYKSAMIIGNMQFHTALKLHQSATTELPKSLTLSVVHDTRDVSEERFPAVLDLLNSVNNSASYRKDLRACKAAIGYAFCAGTADGKALFSYFTSGTQRASVLVDAIRDLLAKVTPEDAECQGSKRICLNVGKIFWSGIPFMSSQIPTQLLRIGPIFILALPTEVTTMAGRRLMESLRRTEGFPNEGKVLINGLSNGYYFYVTTEEEYNGSYYEAGATLFGPHTLNFYAWHASRMLRSLLTTKRQKNSGNFQPKRTPSDLDKSNRLDGISGGGGGDGQGIDGLDFAGFGKNFGQQLLNLRNSYEQGDTVELKFVACNPRHSFGISNHSFLLVQRYNTRLHRWETVRNDASLDTRFLWQQGDFFQSFALIRWDIPAGQRPGDYRIGYRGHCRTFSAALAETSWAMGWPKPQEGEQPPLLPVSGESRRFRVVAARSKLRFASDDSIRETALSEGNIRSHPAASMLQFKPESSSAGAAVNAGCIASAKVAQIMAIFWLLQMMTPLARL